MKRQIEICASFTGKISTGQYENESPFFSVKETLETDDSEQYNDGWIYSRQKDLERICYSQFKHRADEAYAERIAKLYKEIRFYDSSYGKLPSVSSIAGLDKFFNIPADELAQRAARGTCIHKQAEILLMTGEWKDIKDIAECSHEYMTVVNGNLGLALDDVDFRGFLKDYPIKTYGCEEVVYNEEFRYAGRRDIRCVIESKNPGKWDKIEGVKFDVPTILDIKTGSLDKLYGLTQQAAYAKPDDIQQIGLIHLNNEVKQGYSKPIITTNVPRYWDLFLKKRQLFKERYGL